MWVALYVLAIGLWHFVWPYISRTLEQEQVIYNVYTWLPTVTVLMVLLAIRAISSNYLKTTVAVHVMTQWWCASAALSAVYAFLQALGLDQWYVQSLDGLRIPHGQYWTKGIMGSFGNPEYLALYLALLFPLCLLFKAKRYLVYCVMFLLLLWMTQVRGAWVIAAVGLSSYAVSRWWDFPYRWVRPALGLLGVLLVLGGGWMVVHLGQGDERLIFWPAAWERLLNHDAQGLPRVVPAWTGYGLGTFALLFKKSNLLWVHNEWLQSLLEMGVIGTTLLFLMVFHTTRTAWRRAVHSLLDAGWFGVWMAFLASTIIFPSAHWAHTAWVGICAWAVIEREDVSNA